jgi:2-succinyl-5-enolpyruvyl-6-hydroxy-3-cyclohexene-1-carboxylate synthase
MDTGELNLRWGRAIVAKLVALGVRDAVVCPGSRSTPLAFAFAESNVLHSVPVLDERAAGFFALGQAKATGLPVVLVCTSGSAVANFFPAVVEARMAGIPLLVLTADRPQELQGCHAGQTIDQEKVFGGYAGHFLQMPEPSEEGLPNIGDLVEGAFVASLCKAAPAHLNCPFKEPFLPMPEDLKPLKESGSPDATILTMAHDPNHYLPPTADCPYTRVLVVAGPGGPGFHQGFSDLLAFASARGWPVLADPLSNLRNTSEPGREYVVAHYDTILRDDKAANVLHPQAILQAGALPTSKVLRKRMEEWDCPGWTVSPLREDFDPLHSKREILQVFPAALKSSFPSPAKADSNYLHAWQRADSTMASMFDQAFEKCGEPFEAKVSRLLARHMPEGAHLHVASSMPIRDVEWFWPKAASGHVLSGNRGANGIDGTLPTALGIAQHVDDAYLLTGDLAFLHGADGLALARNPYFKGKLTVLLINNNGGGIFENLPVSKHEPPFEDFFATPQHVDFEQLAAAYGAAYRKVPDWDELPKLIENPTNHSIRILEIQTDRKQGKVLRKKFHNLLSQTPD